MKISVELTLTPLQDDFEAPIINFIKNVRASGFTVLENPLSTQVYGDYDAVMQMLQTEIKTTFESLKSVLIHLKIVKSDRSDYEPNF
ncbi:MAG: thiamine-binding protein [Bacteroidota bacterium]